MPISLLGQRCRSMTPRWWTVVCTLFVKIVIADISPEFLYLSHRWKTLPKVYCIRVCPSVSECVRESVHPENLVNTISQKPMKGEFHPILVTDVFGFVDALISFWGQKVKGQGHSRQWPENPVNAISHKPVKGISPNFGHRWTDFHSILVTNVSGFIVLISFWD